MRSIQDLLYQEMLSQAAYEAAKPRPRSGPASRPSALDVSLSAKMRRTAMTDGPSLKADDATISAHQKTN